MTGSTWSIRFLLAAGLLFGSQIVLWTNPLRFETPLLTLGALAWSALLLDLAARYRVRDIFGMFILAGMYGLFSSLLLSPAEALADVPRTLITRVMGGQVFAGLIGWLLFRALARGRLSAPFLLGSGILGVFWGMWGRWSLVAFLVNPRTLILRHMFSDSSTPALFLFGRTEAELIAYLQEASSTPLAVLIAAALVGMTVLTVLWQLAHAQTVGAQRAVPLPAPTEAFLLTRREWAVVSVVTAALLAFRLVQGVIDPISLTIIPTLIAFCWLMLWFQASPRGTTLLDACVPVAAPRWMLAGIAAALFLAGGGVGYALPFTNAMSDPIALAAGFFTGFGLVWLPTVSLVLGGRALKRLARAGKL